MMRSTGVLAAALLIPCVAVKAETRVDDLAPVSASAGRSLDMAIDELDAMLLAGESMPRDFVLGLAHLPADERLLVVVHARRAGLLSGPGLALSGLLDAGGGDQP